MFVVRTQGSLDYNAARILDEVRRDEGVTQRELSSRLGIALGVTNSYVRRLARKGYLKVTTLPRNRLKYFVTPSGLALKARLTYEYLSGSLHFYQEARRRAAEVLSRLERKGARRIAFLGHGDLAEIAYLSLQETRLEFAGLFDDARPGAVFFGRPVRPESGIPASGADHLLYTHQDWETDRPYEGSLPVVNLFGEAS